MMIVEDIFHITGRGIVVTTTWDGLPLKTGDKASLQGHDVVITGIETMGGMRAGKPIGLLLRTDLKKEDIKVGWCIMGVNETTKQVRACAVDAVVVDPWKDEILLVQRKFEPFKGFWVLPGGFVDPDENTQQATVREVKEETGLDVVVMALVGVYSDPNRDVRQNISIAYYCDVEGGELSDSEETIAKWFPFDNMPAELGFDHKQIIEDALCIQLL